MNRLNNKTSRQYTYNDDNPLFGVLETSKCIHVSSASEYLIYKLKIIALFINFWTHFNPRAICEDDRGDSPTALGSMLLIFEEDLLLYLEYNRYFANLLLINFINWRAIFSSFSNIHAANQIKCSLALSLIRIRSEWWYAASPRSNSLTDQSTGHSRPMLEEKVDFYWSNHNYWSTRFFFRTKQQSIWNSTSTATVILCTTSYPHSNHIQKANWKPVTNLQVPKTSELWSDHLEHLTSSYRIH